MATLLTNSCRWSDFLRQHMHAICAVTGCQSQHRPIVYKQDQRKPAEVLEKTNRLLLRDWVSFSYRIYKKTWLGLITSHRVGMQRRRLEQFGILRKGAALRTSLRSCSHRRGLLSFIIRRYSLTVRCHSVGEQRATVTEHLICRQTTSVSSTLQLELRSKNTDVSETRPTLVFLPRP